MPKMGYGDATKANQELIKDNAAATFAGATDSLKAIAAAIAALTPGGDATLANQVLIKASTDGIPYLNDGVYVNSDGYAGTAWPIGTPAYPVSNIADAKTIAIARKLKNLYLVNPSDIFTLGSDFKFYNFIGPGWTRFGGPFLNPGQNSIDGSTFRRLYLYTSLDPTATSNGIYVEDCLVNFRLNGDMQVRRCQIFDLAQLGNKSIYLFDCETPRAYYSYLSNHSYLSINGFKGEITIDGHGDADICAQGSIIIDSMYGSGTITIFDAALVLNNSDTPTVDDYSSRRRGRAQTFTKNITSAANAGNVTVATVTTQPVLVKRVVLRSNGATTANLTSAAILGGTSQVVTFISAAVAVQASLNAADKQVSGVGAWTLDATKTIVIALVGIASTAVDLDVDIEYEAMVDGGYLA